MCFGCNFRSTSSWVRGQIITYLALVELGCLEWMLHHITRVIQFLRYVAHVIFQQDGDVQGNSSASHSGGIHLLLLFRQLTFSFRSAIIPPTRCVDRSTRVIFPNVYFRPSPRTRSHFVFLFDPLEARKTAFTFKRAIHICHKKQMWKTGALVKHITWIRVSRPRNTHCISPGERKRWLTRS